MSKPSQSNTTHTCVLKSIQDDSLGFLSIEEKGHIMNYLLTNLNTISAYKAVSDVQLYGLWLRHVGKNEFTWSVLMEPDCLVRHD